MSNKDDKKKSNSQNKCPNITPKEGHNKTKTTGFTDTTKGNDKSDKGGKGTKK